MKILVHARPRSKVEKVTRMDQQSSLGLEELSVPREIVNKRTPTLPVYKVWIKDAPIEGKANDAIVRVLAEYFKVSKSSVRLVSGPTSKQKVFEIDANIV